MMDNWRRQKSDNYNQNTTRTRSHNKKPPLGSWHPTVPSWEKRFCTSVGSVPWRKILEIKRVMHLYDNVVKWNDSAGEEAFRNAKNRFYAMINGLPCDLSLPDSDIYIDEIDWNSTIDPELVLDLECESVVTDADGKHENVVIFGDTLLSSQGFSSSGWGDGEEDLRKATDSSLENNDNQWNCNNVQSSGAVEGNGWGDFGNNSWCSNENNGAAMGESGWGDGWNNSWAQNQYQNNFSGSEDVNHTSNNGDWATWDVNNGMREGTGRHMSRYRTSRFRGDDSQKNHSRRNGYGKRVNFISEQPNADPRQWNLMNSCAPVSHHASGKAGHRWSWEKPVS